MRERVYKVSACSAVGWDAAGDTVLLSFSLGVTVLPAGVWQRRVAVAGRAHATMLIVQ